MFKILLIVLTLLFQSSLASAVIVGSINGATINVNTDSTPPTVSSATIGTNGTTVTLGMSETVTRSAGTFDMDCNTAGNNLTMTYSSGSGSSSLVYTLGTTVNSGDTCNLDYDGTSGGIIDSGNNSLATITNGSVTNNSTQSSADAQIVFYYNCNGPGAASVSPQKGSGSILYTDDSHISFSSMTNGVGNGLFMSTAYYGIVIPMSGNLSNSVGTMGLVWRASTITSGGAIFSAEATYNTAPRLMAYAGDSTHIEWRYMDGDQSLTVAANTTYYFEFAYDYNNHRQSYRQYNLSTDSWVVGPSWTEITTLTGAAPTGTNVSFASMDGSASAQGIDQIMFSSAYQKDLHAVWNSTNP